MSPTSYLNNNIQLGGNDLTDLIKECNGLDISITNLFVPSSSPSFLDAIKKKDYTLSSTDTDSDSPSSSLSPEVLEEGIKKLRKTKKEKEEEPAEKTNTADDDWNEFSDTGIEILEAEEYRHRRIKKVKDILLAIGYTDNEEYKDKNRYYLNAFNNVAFMALIMNELKDFLLPKGYTDNKADPNYYLYAKQNHLEEALKEAKVTESKFTSKDIIELRDNIKKILLIKHYLLSVGYTENPFETNYYLNINEEHLNGYMFKYKNQDNLVSYFGYTKNPEDANYYMKATKEDVDKIKEQEQLIIRKNEVKDFLLLIGYTEDAANSKHYLKAEEEDLVKAEQNKIKYEEPLKLLYPEKQISQLTRQEIEHVRKREDLKDKLLEKGFGDESIEPKKVKDPTNFFKEIDDPNHKEYYLFANDAIVEKINQEIRQKEERKEREAEEKAHEKQIQIEKETKERLDKIKDLLVSYFEYSEENYLTASNEHIKWIEKREEHKDALKMKYKKNENSSSPAYYLNTPQSLIDQIEKAKTTSAIARRLAEIRRGTDSDSDSDSYSDSDSDDYDPDLGGGSLKYKVKYN